MWRKIAALGLLCGLCAVVLDASGCAWRRQKAARLAYLQQRLDGHALPLPLEEAWPRALQLLADEKFPLVGRDRMVTGQPPSSILDGLLDAGFETRAPAPLRLEAQTSWNHAKLRYRIEGLELGSDASRITFGLMHRKEHYELEERPVRDYEMELVLLERLDAEAGAAIREGAERAASLAD